MSPIRRDGEGGRQVGSSWESLIDRQIREATEAGAFDDLPHQGERLPLEDDSAAGEWAMAHRMLRNAGAAPPWIEADKEARRLLEHRRTASALGIEEGQRARMTAPISLLIGRHASAISNVDAVRCRSIALIDGSDETEMTTLPRARPVSR